MAGGHQPQRSGHHRDGVGERGQRLRLHDCRAEWVERGGGEGPEYDVLHECAADDPAAARDCRVSACGVVEPDCDRVHRYVSSRQHVGAWLTGRLGLQSRSMQEEHDEFATPEILLREYKASKRLFVRGKEAFCKREL